MAEIGLARWPHRVGHVQLRQRHHSYPFDLAPPYRKQTSAHCRRPRRGVQGAATAAGGDRAPWLRHMVRRISATDFPARWQEERLEARSHDSRDYDTHFMLRLDKASRTKLQALVKHFHVSKAAIIRQLIAQAMPEHLPKSWQIRVNEHRTSQARQIVPR
jgi:hypothetical protein